MRPGPANRSQAVQSERHGDADVLSWRDTPWPELTPGGVLVRIAAAGVNAKDTFVRKARFRRLTGSAFPMPSGYDASGVVAASAVAGFAPGDRVFGNAEQLEGRRRSRRRWPTRRPCRSLA